MLPISPAGLLQLVTYYVSDAEAVTYHPEWSSDWENDIPGADPCEYSVDLHDSPSGDVVCRLYVGKVDAQLVAPVLVIPTATKERAQRHAIELLTVLAWFFPEKGTPLAKLVEDMGGKLAYSAPKRKDDSLHYALPQAGRDAAVRAYREAQRKGEVQTVDAWARHHYGISGRTLRSWIRDLEGRET